MSRIHELWKSNELGHNIRVWLPDIGRMMQMADHFRPPEALSKWGLFYYSPSNLSEVEWQVKTLILPQFHNWITEYDQIAQNRMRRDYSEQDEKFREWWEEDKGASSEDLVISGPIALALLAPAISHAYVALRMMQYPEWGITGNALSSFGLLYLGDTDVNLEILSNIIEPKEIPAVWEEHPFGYSKKSKKIFNPLQLPLSMWHQVLKTLSTYIDRDNSVITTFLAIAWEEPQYPVSQEIFVWAFECGLVNEFTFGAIIANHHHIEKDRLLHLFQEVAKDKELGKENPDLQEAIQKKVDYFQQHNEFTWW